ncbi:ABC transporter substrate-binding protein [Rhodococcus sp. ARC_M6]|uniref:ABC transporter substrate-binding protein n=1 Tax=Rhodococcus sp. ARC_M6 TaxID=2928852 RepID=UPI001FB446A5|nr:ABC transporter substrate-binding protein [Rhodococcus sp. ARC_M6]MCJ0903089.1 ABC transporter substrate-binding protein [Rhodococcus sp. ARC_M6]
MRSSYGVRARIWMVVLASAALVVTSCAGNSGGETTDASDVTIGVVGNQGDGGDPKSGGEVSFATYNGISSLDPADRQDGGASGGSEMAAIYDLLMRFDTEAGQYVPQLAQSLSANADNTVWTLKLRDGATFSDGTPVDSAAVLWSIDHYLQKKGTHSQVWKTTVRETNAPDSSTIVFTLVQPWDEFPIMFTTGPGMIVAPSSMATGTFAPVGAGPFTVEKFASQDELVLAARPTYWDGAPYLEKLRFPAIVNEQAKLEGLHTDGVQVAYLRSPDYMHEALEAGDPGFVTSASMAGVLAINQREDRAAKDVRVRQAIVAAVDPNSFNERVQGGFGAPGTDMFAPWSKWHGSVPGNGYDPEAAKKYLAEAKADGYDGKLTYVGMNDPGTQRSALAFQSMLQAVGFTVDISYATSINDLISRQFAKHDFDISYTGFNILEQSPYTRMYGNLFSESPSNILGYKNPQMDQLLSQLQAAAGVDQRKAVLDDIQKLVNDTAPMAVVNSSKVFIAWGQNVHGVTPSVDGIMLFGNTWLN